jgi:hypothetical protein
VELLNLRAQLADDAGEYELSSMQKTANTMIRIGKAAAAYYKANGEYPACSTVAGFAGAAESYAEEDLDIYDAWGHTLRCVVQPHGLWYMISNAGPDGDFDRGEDFDVSRAMSMSEDPEEADISLEAGYFAPPWWSKGSVLALYR